MNILFREGLRLHKRAAYQNEGNCCMWSRDDWWMFNWGGGSGAGYFWGLKDVTRMACGTGTGTPLAIQLCGK
jgi:hypothetical protein